jgi:prepilin-type N-terminal cleavage/methylation domain-containing protein
MTSRTGGSNQNGFTLIELMVVVLVMGILSVALANFIFGWMNTAGLQQVRSNLQYDAEYALDTVNNDIMLSGSVDSTNRWPDPNGPGGNYGWTSNSQTLILAKVATDSSGNPIFLDSTDYITQKDDEIYYLSGTTLYRRTLSSGTSGDSAVTTCPPSLSTSSCPPDMTVATNVSAWSVAYYGANNNVVSPDLARSVQLSITLSGSYGAEPLSASYTTRMVFRND